MCQHIISFLVLSWSISFDLVIGWAQSEEDVVH